MTPDQKTALHRAIDQALSLGAFVDVSIHSSFAEDDQPLINLLGFAAPVGEEVKIKTIQPGDSPTGRRYRTVTTSPDDLTSVSLFTRENVYRRDKTETNTDTDTRRFDVV